jgi:FkbM family methyltransferase
MKKIIAQTLGRKLPYFKGKNKIIRILYSPDRNLNSGEKFITDYFEKKYEGITSNFIDWGVYFYGGLEKGLVNYIKTEISQFTYFFDIGSNSGTISLPFCDKKNLKIICFEPLEYSYQKLINNFEINNMFEKHIFHKIALSNETGESFIYFSNTDANIGTATLNPGFNNNNHNDKQKIILEKLDNLYDFKNQSLFIKIDVEGHEDKLIDGSLNIIKNNKVLMYLETVNTDLLNKLKKLNFKIFYPIFKEGKFEFINKQVSHNVILKNY